MTTTFADLPAETIINIIDHLGGDGHGLYDPQFLTQLGVPEELIKRVTITHKSDGTYKGSIFNPDGSVVKEMTAVYSLDLYQIINSDLGLPSSKMLGRGSEARELHRQIKQFVANESGNGLA